MIKKKELKIILTFVKSKTRQRLAAAKEVRQKITKSKPENTL